MILSIRIRLRKLILMYGKLYFFNRMWYSITTLSPIIVIYRQVLPNHRKISIFEGRNMENCVTVLFLKNHQNADFW